MLGLRPPGFEFRILCLEDSVISIISPSSGGSPGPVQPISAQRWPKARFISFHLPLPVVQFQGPLATGFTDKYDVSPSLNAGTLFRCCVPGQDTLSVHASFD